jgi:hypothetical protein
MNHALRLLIVLQGKSLLRRTVRGLRSAKGVIFFALALLVVGLWLWSAIMMARHPGQQVDPEHARVAAPLGMLGMCLLMLLTSDRGPSGGGAIPFTPAEVDLLFPAPFTRRQLLAYKIAKMLAGTIFSGLVSAAALWRFAAGWFQALAAMVLAMSFLQLLRIAISLASQIVGARAYSRGRKAILVIIFASIVLPLVPALLKQQHRGFYELASALRASKVGAILLAPLDPFGRIFTQTRLWAGLVDASIVLAMDGVLLVLIFWLDADYLEVSAEQSKILYEKVRRVREGGIMAIGFKARASLPTLPHLGGAGAIAWRQLTSALRGSRGLLVLLVVMMVIAILPMIRSGGGGQRGDRGAGSAIGVLVMMTLVIGNALKFDFRGDLDRMDHLKSLPASALAVCIGQLIAPTLMMTACHLLFVGIISVAQVLLAPPQSQPPSTLLIGAALLALPVNALLFEIENLIFLYFPSRAAVAAGDFQGVGRQILVFFAKALLLVFAGGIALLVAVVVHAASGVEILSLASAAACLAAIVVGLVPLLARAFRTFDVSIDVPP